MAATGYTERHENERSSRVGYHVSYVGIGPLPRPLIAFCVRVTGQPTSVHVSRAARQVLSTLLEGLARRSLH